jgi:6-phosphogluconolactonase
MIVALGCDHAGFPSKARIVHEVEAAGHEVLDLGAFEEHPEDDYPVFARRVCEALRAGRAERGVLFCGSGVGVSVAANKFQGIRAALCHDSYSAHQGVEHDAMNVLCLGTRVVGPELAAELVRAFLAARFSGEERHTRRLAEVDAIERERPSPDTAPRSGGLEIFSDRAQLASAAAEKVTALARESIAARGRFSLALSGGSTPTVLYELLSREPFAARLDWLRVHVFWGDERCVGPDSPESNYRAAREALLDRVPIPPANVHRIRGEDEPERAAWAYEGLLRDFFKTKEGPPARSFDLVFLGLGEDGHTASLFPGTPPVTEERRWVMPNRAEKAAVSARITLTPIVLAAAREVIFLVTGTSKAERLRDTLEGPHAPTPDPVRLVRPRRGALRWMVDTDAAARLRRAA